MVRITGAPGRYVQGENEIANVGHYAQAVCKHGVLAVLDAFVYETYAPVLQKSFAEAQLALHITTFQGECCMPQIQCLTQLAAAQGLDCILGMGGGKTQDTAKASAFYAGVPVIVCPTIASSDAPCSAIAVLYTPKGVFERYLSLPQNPAIVLVDSQIIVHAPSRFLSAGMGDALSTYFEARSCVASGAASKLGAQPSVAAFGMARQCYQILQRFGAVALADAEKQRLTPAVEHIIEANTYLSGIGFESCGLAAAHAIHNGLVTLPHSHNAMHGEIVAFTTLAQLMLEKAPQARVKRVAALCKAIKLPLTLQGIGFGDADAYQLKQAAKVSCSSNDTMGNMPFNVTPKAVYEAILQADSYGAKLA